MKIFSLLHLLFILSLLSTRASAVENCLTDEELIKAKNLFVFTIKTDAKGNPSITDLDKCNNENFQNKVIRAVHLIIKTNVTLANNEANQNILNILPIDYLKNRVRIFIFEPEDKAPCNEGIANAYVLSNEGPFMHICPALADYSVLDIAGTLIHESRHTDGDFAHIDCTHGSYNQMEACDVDYTKKGSYAIETEFYLKVSKSPLIDERTRSQARAHTIDFMINRFNTPPLDLAEGVFLQKQDNQVVFFNGKTIEDLSLKLTPMDLMINRLGLPTFYNAEQGTVKSYTYSPDLINTEGDYADNFRKSDIQTRQSMLDLGYEDGYACLLFTNKVHCESNFPIFPGESNLILQNILPAALLNIDNHFAVVDKSGKIYLLKQSLAEMQLLSEKDLVPLNVSLFITSLVPFNKTQIGLSNTGEPFYLENLNSKSRPINELTDMKFKRLVGPTWYSKKLEALWLR